MREPETKPALTAEEWAKVEFPPLPRDPRDHALAALCLYGQPFGFTPEDVALLLDLAEVVDNPLGMDLRGGKEEFEGVLSIAARIAALLPPE